MNWLRIVVLACVLAGCAQTVEIEHRQLADAPDNRRPLPVKVWVQMPPEDLRKELIESGLIAVGVLNEWKIDLHDGLGEAAAQMLQRRFENVELRQDYSFDCTDCGLFVRPAVTDIELNNVTMQAVITLDLPFFNSQGQLVGRLNEVGQSPILSAKRVGVGVAGYFVPFFGTLVGANVLETTVRRALENALHDMVAQLDFETRDGWLARTWLPLDLIDKARYGRQEHAAERVARESGCDLSYDGLRLVEEAYFREVYEAHCWAVPEFEIVCEYGRCAANVEALTEITPRLPQVKAGP